MEIGAGIGLPSFSIAQKAASLIISDHDPDAVTLLEKNIRQLGLSNTHAMRIDWNDFPSSVSAETILLSDINYAPAEFEGLLKLIKTWLAAGALLILSTPQRILGAPFVTAVSGFMQSQTTIVVEENGTATDISILVLRNNRAAE